MARSTTPEAFHMAGIGAEIVGEPRQALQAADQARPFHDIKRAFFRTRNRPFRFSGGRPATVLSSSRRSLLQLLWRQRAQACQ